MYRYVFIAATALSFAACTSEEINTSSQGEVALEVNADISGTQTRASGTQWGTNDEIGISTVTGTTTDYTNRAYRWNGSSFEAVAENIYFQSAEEVTFNAYYPYTADATYTDVSTSAENQTADTQPKIDFLYASGATASSSEPTVDFTGDHAFTHRMSQITLTFIEGSDMYFGGQLSYTLGDLKMTGTFNPLDGTAAVDDDATPTSLTIDLTEVQPTSGSYTAPSLILFPQEVAGIPITVTVGGQDYTATLSVKDGKLQSGNNYTWEITVSKTDFSVSDAEIKNWETVDNGGTTATM